MSEWDLTEATEAGAAALFAHLNPEHEGDWPDLPALAKHHYRETALPVVRAVIALQPRESS